MKSNIILFSQSEKAKAGLIWLTQLVELHAGLPPIEKHGAEQALRLIGGQVSNEMHLAARLTRESEWNEARNAIEKALLMIDSGVVEEAAYHLTQALSRVTGLGQRAMSRLQEEGLL